MLLSDAAYLFTIQPSSLIYHLILILLLALTASIAFLFYRRTQNLLAQRWLRASSILLVLQLIVFLVEALSWSLGLQVELILPYLDRAASVLGIVVFAWALLPSDSSSSPELIAASIGGLIILAIPLSIWISNQYPELQFLGYSFFNFFWYFVGLFLAGLALILLLVLRPYGWLTGIIGFLLIIAGYALQILNNPVEITLAGFVRLFELFAYPLFLMASVQAILESLQEERKQAFTQKPKLEVSQEQLDFDRARAVSALITPLTMEEFSKQIVRSVAELVRCEYCLLLTAPQLEGTFSVALGYDLIREVHFIGSPLDSRRCPVISSSMMRKRLLVLPTDQNVPDTRILGNILGIESIGPILMSPLVSDNQLHGGLLLLSPFARTIWREEECKIVSDVAEIIASRTVQIKNLASLEKGDISELETIDLNRQLEVLKRDHALLREQSGLELTQEQMDLLEGSPSDFQADSHPDTVLRLQAEIGRLKYQLEAQSGSEDIEQVDQLKNELQYALQELAEIRARNAELEQVEGFRDKTQDQRITTVLLLELRKPIHSILSYSDLLLGESIGLLGAMQKNFLERIQASSKRMEGLMADLNQITANEEGKDELPPSQVDFLACVDEAVSMCNSAIKDKGLSLSLDLPENLTLLVGDEDSLTQIVYHLLNNAIGASPRNSDVYFHLREEKFGEQSYVILSVADNGIGIAPEDMSRIFLSSSHDQPTKVEGLADDGLSVSILKILTETYKGRVWIESERGEGTTISVLLPLTS